MAHAHPAWGLIKFIQSRGSPLSPCETLPQHGGRKKRNTKKTMLRPEYGPFNYNLSGVCSEHTEFIESWKSAHTGLILFISVSEVETHRCWHIQQGRCMIQRSRKRHRGKHSWLPLSLLTPAVGCNLHSNRTWKHCAELIFEVVIFNTPVLSLFNFFFFLLQHDMEMQFSPYPWC